MPKQLAKDCVDGSKQFVHVACRCVDNNDSQVEIQLQGMVPMLSLRRWNIQQLDYPTLRLLNGLKPLVRFQFG